MSSELEALINEVRLLFNQCSRLAEDLHSELPVTVAMRAVLEFVTGNGPTTVPGIARSRRVSRQHIQVLVNDLIDHGLVRMEANPGHKRSLLVTLTAKGRRTFEAMRQRERRLLRAAMAVLPKNKLK
ncbi:MAG: MarR family transcriptional regulator, partial [Planctomycetes bacterium]|nr:MarR family transcriptional regulator [Planctomycetota bacterium]